jgi:2-haloacid dehalogenase
VAAPSIVVFDVNETLLDIESITPFFEEKFGDRNVLREWYNQLILYSNAITLAGHYETFFALGQRVFEMLGTIYGVSIEPADLEKLRSSMLSMPAHKDVPEGLQLLKEAGFRLMTLKNSPPSDGGTPLERAGLGPFIERQFSVDPVRKFKPAPEIYRLITENLNVAPSTICFVSAHSWDNLGAQSVGFYAGFVARAGNATFPVRGLPQPDVIAPDLVEMANRMIARWR